MPRKRYTPEEEEIIQHLRTVELDTGKGLAVLDVSGFGYLKCAQYSNSVSEVNGLHLP